MQNLLQLFSRQGSYKDPKTGDMRTSVHYYVAPAGVEIDPLHPDWRKLIGININYFPDPSTGKDPKYSSRKQIFDMFAMPLPPAVFSDGVQSQDSSPVDVSSGVSSGVISGFPDFHG